METFVQPAATVPSDAALVTVIMPVYQGEQLVLGAVRSALNQSHRELEVIVVDDGSSDSTLAVLATIHDPRLRVVAQSNAGTAAARNRALALARGRYIAFLDADDRWFPQKIETELRTLQSAADPIGVAYSSYYAVDDRGRLLNAAPQRRLSGNLLDALLDGEDFLIPSACLFDRRLIDDVGRFELDLFHEDYDFMLRIAQRYPIYATGQRLVVYRQSTSGKCRGILADFDRARAEELSLVSGLTATLTTAQLFRLRQNVLRSLYCRFLMYGFTDHARRLAPEVELGTLRTTKKGQLAALFASTGVNALIVARQAIQGYHLVARQRTWQKRLAQACLHLGYTDERPVAPPQPAEHPNGAASRSVCIAIPTFRRQELLRRLLAGIALQELPPQVRVEVFVIDNDRTPSARSTVEVARDGFPFALQYVHLSEPGLSTVRNFALAHARDGFDFLAMIDDDEYPQTTWLKELLGVAERAGADIVIGPVPKQLAAEHATWIAAGHFLDLPSYPDGASINDGYSGNCLLSMPAMRRFDVTFDGALNLAGGEDMLFFRELLARGAKMAYAAHAVAFEAIGPERLRWPYLLKLSFRRGNTLTFCDRRLNGTRRGLTVRALKGCARLALGWMSFFPRTMIRGRVGALQAGCDIAHGLGSLAGLFGHIYQGYRRVESSGR